MNDTDARDFPLGAPLNRPPAPSEHPIEGRPNWFRDRSGREFYREPNAPPKASEPAKSKPA